MTGPAILAAAGGTAMVIGIAGAFWPRGRHLLPRTVRIPLVRAHDRVGRRRGRHHTTGAKS